MIRTRVRARRRHHEGLVDRLAVVLREHIADGDELHVTYNAMQSGWQDHAPRKGNLIRPPEAGWTELRFKYSAFVVLRAHAVPPSVGEE